MKKWEYKIVPLKKMVEDSSNHDIDVSVEKGKQKAEKSRTGMENTLNKLGDEGWELVVSYRDFAVLKKRK